MSSIAYNELAGRAADRLVAGIKRAERLASRVVVVSTPRALSRVGASPRLDFVRRLPSPSEVAESNFALVERVLGAQKEYTLRVLGAATREAPPAPVAEQPAAPRRRKPAAS